MNIVTAVINMMQFDFMQHAFYAGTIAAILAGVVGYFLLLRSLAFAGHGLAHIGFTGATGAMLLGIHPLLGQLIITLLAALGMGSFGARVQQSDMVIAIILALALGLGSLFLHFYVGSANIATSLLFGDLLGVSMPEVYVMLALGIGCLLLLAIIARPLLCASLEPELAEARGVSLKLLAILFLCIVAVAVSLSSQVVGVLLVFTLLVGPAAIALNLTKSVGAGLLLSALLAMMLVWVSLFLAYVSNWPISFLMSGLVFIGYLLSCVAKSRA